jgi:hypothetical protein
MIAALSGAVAYGAASGVFRAMAEYRRSSSIGPRLEDAQKRLAYVEGLLGIKEPDDDVTPNDRAPLRRRP